MNKEEIYKLLKNKNIWYEISEHKAVYNMQDLSEIDLPYPEADAKNIFVRDDKKRNYYLITILGQKRVNLKEFKNKNNTRNLSFASEEDLLKILGLTPGAVTPFGLLNDKENIVKYYIDSALCKEEGLIGIHPNDNTATVWMKTKDLIEIIKEYGNEVYIIDI